MDNNAAHNMLNLTLKSGWFVKEKPERDPNQSGSDFSVGNEERSFCAFGAASRGDAAQEPPHHRHLRRFDVKGRKILRSAHRKCFDPAIQGFPTPTH